MIGLTFGIIFIIIGIVLIVKKDKVAGGILIAMGALFAILGFMTAASGFGGGRRR